MFWLKSQTLLSTTSPPQSHHKLEKKKITSVRQTVFPVPSFFKIYPVVLKLPTYLWVAFCSFWGKKNDSFCFKPVMKKSPRGCRSLFSLVEWVFLVASNLPQTDDTQWTFPSPSFCPSQFHLSPCISHDKVQTSTLVMVNELSAFFYFLFRGKMWLFTSKCDVFEQFSPQMVNSGNSQVLVTF